MKLGEPLGPLRQKAYELLAVLLLIVCGVPVLAHLLEPIAPVLIVLIALGALMWFVLRR